jgi:Fuc2NAc and GlcNAc transferase
VAGAAAAGIVVRREALILGLGMVVLAWTGWKDDTDGLKARTRIAIHVLVAAWTVYMLGGFPTLRVGLGQITLGVAGAAIAVLGMVWSINLFNFMDGIDGLAGSQAALIFGGVAPMLVAAGNRSLATIAIILAAASSGFLVWNWPPAKIFLGDVGSGALGYLIASLAVASENAGSVPAIAFGVVGGVFVVDSTVTLLRRLMRGHHPAKAHRDHAYQRLTRNWNSHRRVTLAAAGLTLSLVVLGGVATMHPALLLPILATSWASLAIVLVVIERRVPMFADEAT